MNKSDLRKDIIEYVVETKSIELLSEISEKLFDESLSNNLFKDIPVVNWVGKFLSIYNLFSDKLFLSKLIVFLQSLNNINREFCITFPKTV